MSKRLRLDKSFVYKRFKKDLTAKYGEKKALDIWNAAQTELESLEREYPDEEKKSFVYPAVAIYRAIEQYAPGEALETTRAFGTRTGKRVEAILRKITALPGMPNLIWKKMNQIAGKMADGYECKDIMVTPHLCSMDVVGCPLYDCAKRVGTPEAAQLICCMDKEYMNGMRGVAYSRTKSLAEGDDCCDYRLTDSRDTISS